MIMELLGFFYEKNSEMKNDLIINCKKNRTEQVFISVRTETFAVSFTEL